MAVEDTFRGAQSGLTFLNAYINTVAQEIGMERALAADSQVCQAMGAAQGKMIKEQAGIEAFDAQTAGRVLSQAIEDGFGIVFEPTEESSDRVVLNVGRCPVYEAGLAVGMDTEAIEASCRAGALTFMDAMTKELNPDLSYELIKFRSTADEPCEETIVLA